MTFFALRTSFRLARGQAVSLRNFWRTWLRCLLECVVARWSSRCGCRRGDREKQRASTTQALEPRILSNLLCFVTGLKESGGQVNVGDSAEFTSANFQGAVYATNNIELDTTSNVDGPMVGSQVMLGQSVTTNFPSITIVPASMPSNPTAYAQVDPPAGYSG